MIGLQMFALQQTEPDFDLIEPRRIGRQPVNLEMQLPFTCLFLGAQPAFELLGSVCGSIIQDEGHRLDAPSQRFRNDFLLHKCLEIDKAFVRPAGSVDLAVCDRESGKQMACATAMVASFVPHGLAWVGWARWLLPFASLDRGFLVETDQPRACAQERSRLTVCFEHWTRSLQEGLGMMDVLPGMIAPGTNAFGSEPASYCARRDAWKRWVLGHTTSQFRSTPARERSLAQPRQATGDGRNLRAYLRGKNASVPHCEARQPENAF